MAGWMHLPSVERFARRSIAWNPYTRESMMKTAKFGVLMLVAALCMSMSALAQHGGARVGGSVHAGGLGVGGMTAGSGARGGFGVGPGLGTAARTGADVDDMAAASARNSGQVVKGSKVKATHTAAKAADKTEDSAE